MTALKLVYIAGAFEGRDDLETEANIVRAEQVAERVRQLGAFPVCPHSLGRNFKHLGERAFWLAGTKELLRRTADAVTLVPGWEQSEGTCDEIADASARTIPVFETTEDLGAWLEGGSVVVG